MSQVIEDAVKALAQFESALDQIREEAVDREKRLAKDAADLSDQAKAEALDKAGQMAGGRLSAARTEAEQEAAAIRLKGEEALKSFEEAISMKKAAAAGMVAAKLLGSEQ